MDVRVEIIPSVWRGANFAEDMKMSCRHFRGRRST